MIATFHGGLENFKNYLVEKGTSSSGSELVEIMDTFSKALHDHLKEEPPTIAALSKYYTPETPIDIVGLALEAGKKQVSVGFLFNVLQVYFLNMESVEFEDGMWHTSSPLVSKPVRWIMTKGAPMWNLRL
jgi:hypothetical protein